VTTGEREIVADEARIVERIFREFIAGISPKQIAKNMNREGVPGPFGGPWSPSGRHRRCEATAIPVFGRDEMRRLQRRIHHVV